MADDDGFLARWARRKAEVRRGAPAPSPAPAAAVAAAVAPAVTPAPARAPSPAAPPTPAAAPAPTLDDVARLTPDADFSRFVAGGVDRDVKNAALKKLFADPHFNVMDGLDTYIDDYGRPDPLPAGMLRQMVQTRLLGLFDDEAPRAPDAAAAAHGAPALPSDTAPEPAPDEDPDLRLQPDDDAGRPGPGPGPGGDPGRQP